ncbi:MAG: hypothetical protein ACOYNN_08720 [Terrimicrobiaceae bacterium]
MESPVSNKFQLPVIHSKTISESSMKVYMSHLNRLAKMGITTPELILENQKKIVKHIKETIPDDDAISKQKKRLWMTTILYAVADKPDKEKMILKKYYPETFNYPAPGTAVTLKNGTTIIWKSREDYFKK